MSDKDQMSDKDKDEEEEEDERVLDKEEKEMDKGDTVNSLLTHSSNNPYSLIPHTFFGPPSWFVEKWKP